MITKNEFTSTKQHKGDMIDYSGITVYICTSTGDLVTRGVNGVVRTHSLSDAESELYDWAVESGVL